MDNKDNIGPEPETDRPRKFTSKRGLMALTALLAIIALATALTAAWYARNRDSGQNELGIKSDTTDLSLVGYGLYYGKIDEEGNVTPTFISDPTNLDSMNDYDAVIGRNDDTAVYFKLTVAGKHIENKDPIKITITRANTGAIESNTDPEGFKYTSDWVDGGTVHGRIGKVAVYLSNIVSAQVAQIAAISEEANVSTVYDACKACSWGTPTVSNVFFSEIPNAVGRKTKFSESVTKSNTIEFTVDNYDSIDDSTGSKMAVFFVRIDYLQPLIEVYLNGNYSTLSGRLNQRITESFIGDISNITVSPVSSGS